MSENGRHARLFSRLIDDMRADGELSKGVKLPNGGILTIELGTSQPLPVRPLKAASLSRGRQQCAIVFGSGATALI